MTSISGIGMPPAGTTTVAAAGNAKPAAATPEQPIILCDPVLIGSGGTAQKQSLSNFPEVAAPSDGEPVPPPFPSTIQLPTNEEDQPKPDFPPVTTVPPSVNPANPGAAVDVKDTLANWSTATADQKKAVEIQIKANCAKASQKVEVKPLENGSAISSEGIVNIEVTKDGVVYTGKCKQNEEGIFRIQEFQLKPVAKNTEESANKQVQELEHKLNNPNLTIKESYFNETGTVTILYNKVENRYTGYFAKPGEPLEMADYTHVPRSSALVKNESGEVIFKRGSHDGVVYRPTLNTKPCTEFKLK